MKNLKKMSVLQAGSNVQRIESDLASMAKTVAQLKSVLEQNQLVRYTHWIDCKFWLCFDSKQSEDVFFM